MTFKTATTAPDHIKARLSYITGRVVSDAALTMKDHLGIRGPYNEEVWVLIPAAEAFSGINEFDPQFERLKEAKLVPDDATLVGVVLQAPEHSPTILAYILP